MAKSRLSTEVLRQLRARGFTCAQLGAWAGITPSGVKARLHPDTNRRRALQHYYENHAARKEYSLRRYSQLQAESLRWASRRGPWAEWELRYLEEQGPILPAQDVARDLERTYCSVLAAASRHGVKLRL